MSCLKKSHRLSVEVFQVGGETTEPRVPARVTQHIVKMLSLKCISTQSDGGVCCSKDGEDIGRKISIVVSQH